MEINGDGLLEELLSMGMGMGRETIWEGNPEGEGEGEAGEINGLFSTSSSCCWSFHGNSSPISISAVVDPPLLPPILPNSDCFTTPSIKPDLDLDCSFTDLMYNTPLFGNQINNSVETVGFPQAQAQEAQPGAICKLEGELPLPLPGGGYCVEVENRERKSKVKRVEGQPSKSKNLMAERRRRKRLNDRLSMLRSVVPKITKMDRTSILGDTIDYMKELLERINTLQVQEEEMEFNEISIFRQSDTQSLIKNKNSPSPKFEVERRNNSETRVEMRCSGKQGLLLSTVTTLEALGLEIQQCVISCFNDFSLHAACTSQEVEEQTSVVNSEDIKQALFRNAGYGGSCL